ncbi:MAG: glycerate kinase [Spirochaetales bacterium]|nr:glycerate kinase [Spirochaetales bacterium]
MKIIFAVDSFKNAATSREINGALIRGFEQVLDGEFISIPISDGGEGLIDSLRSDDFTEYSVKVLDPIGREISASYIGARDYAIIEMARSSGLQLLKRSEYNPLLASSYGTGQVFLDAVSRGFKRILLGIGGSATCDCGMGFASALGYRFFDKNGEELVACGENMVRVAGIDSSNLRCDFSGVEVNVACDVENPLFGANGASYVYSPQKGADPQMVERLDQGLRVFAEVVERDLGVSLGEAESRGFGAAGGLGAGLYAFVGGKLMRGIDAVLDTLDFGGVVAGADLVITGEGGLDFQSSQGKVVSGVVKRARLLGVPVIAVVGGDFLTTADYDMLGLDAVFSIQDRPMSLEESISKTILLLEKISLSVARTIGIFYNIR